MVAQNVHCEPVWLDYWITLGRAGGPGSSLSGHFGCLPACSLLLGCLTVLSRAGDGDQAILVVEAGTGYSQEGRGLSRFTDPADGASYVMAFCYPGCGPELFCCFDQPDLTATFRFAVRVPDGWECVANGELARSAPGRCVCTFTPVSGMRPYDLTFCAGPFPAAARTRAGRTEVTVRHRRSLLGQVRWLPCPGSPATPAMPSPGTRTGSVCRALTPRTTSCSCRTWPPWRCRSPA
jgi:hypothetical protein